jgi:transcriptional regulator of arginine metabolism
MNIHSHDRRHGLRRRAQILELVRSQAVRSQEQLGQLLRRRGFAVAQPTLSRDIKELGLARTPTGYAAPAVPADFVPDTQRQATVDRVLAQHVLSVQAAASLVVIKTPPASAHPVARALDEAALPGIVGTIAGDDTIFIAAADAATALALERRLSSPLTPTRRDRRARA